MTGSAFLAFNNLLAIQGTYILLRIFSTKGHLIFYDE